jgi:hypothetical protein
LQATTAKQNFQEKKKMATTVVPTGIGATDLQAFIDALEAEGDGGNVILDTSAAVTGSNFSVTQGSPNLSVTGGAFTSELTADQSLLIDDEVYYVQSVTDDDNAVLTENFAGTTNGNATVVIPHQWGNLPNEVALSGTWRWDGTTTVLATDTSQVSVGDYIRLDADPASEIQLFKIQFITPNTSVVIGNPHSLVIPSGAGGSTLSYDFDVAGGAVSVQSSRLWVGVNLGFFPRPVWRLINIKYDDLMVEGAGVDRSNVPTSVVTWHPDADAFSKFVILLAHQGYVGGHKRTSFKNIMFNTRGQPLNGVFFNVGPMNLENLHFLNGDFCIFGLVDNRAVYFDVNGHEQEKRSTIKSCIFDLRGAANQIAYAVDHQQWSALDVIGTATYHTKFLADATSANLFNWTYLSQFINNSQLATRNFGTYPPNTSADFHTPGGMRDLNFEYVDWIDTRTDQHTSGLHCQVYGSAGGTLEQVSFRNCVFDIAGDHPIFMQLLLSNFDTGAGSSVSDFEIVNSTFKNALNGGGIYIDALRNPIGDGVISNCTFINMPGTRGSIRIFRQASHITIVGNDFTQSGELNIADAQGNWSLLPIILLEASRCRVIQKSSDFPGGHPPNTYVANKNGFKNRIQGGPGVTQPLPSWAQGDENSEAEYATIKDTNTMARYAEVTPQ